MAQNVPESHLGWQTPDELAEELNVPVATVYQWKYKGTGPIVHKIGRHLRYRRSDVEAWLAHQKEPHHASGAA